MFVIRKKLAVKLNEDDDSNEKTLLFEKRDVSNVCNKLVYSVLVLFLKGTSKKRKRIV